MKKLVSLLLVLVLALGCTAALAAEYEIRGATSNVETHPHYLGLAKFAELLEEKSGGRIVMEAFHSGTLGSERDIVEGMQFNTIQVGAITSAPLSGFTDSFLIFDLPFLFENVTIARAVCDSDLGAEILASVEPAGLKGLAFMENGMRSVTNNVKPIETPEDFKGIKIRTMENPMHMEAFSVMDADPTPMAFGELFTALQQGTIDAQENPYTVIHSSKFFEVQEYLTITNHLYSPTALLMSLDFYLSLPEDLQAVVDEAAIEAAAYEREQCDIQEAQLLDALKAEGMIVNQPDMAPFVEATKAVYDKYVGEGAGMVHPDILARTQEIIASFGA